MLTGILIFVAVVFIIYAIFTQYSKTPADKTIPNRLWLSVVAGGGAIFAAIMSWLHSGTAP